MKKNQNQPVPVVTSAAWDRLAAAHVERATIAAELDAAVAMIADELATLSDTATDHARELSWLRKRQDEDYKDQVDQRWAMRKQLRDCQRAATNALFVAVAAGGAAVGAIILSIWAVVS